MNQLIWSVLLGVATIVLPCLGIGLIFYSATEFFRRKSEETTAPKKKAQQGTQTKPEQILVSSKAMASPAKETALPAPRKIKLPPPPTPPKFTSRRVSPVTDIVIDASRKDLQIKMPSTLNGAIREIVARLDEKVAQRNKTIVHILKQQDPTSWEFRFFTSQLSESSSRVLKLLGMSCTKNSRLISERMFNRWLLKLSQEFSYQDILQDDAFVKLVLTTPKSELRKFLIDIKQNQGWIICKQILSTKGWETLIAPVRTEVAKMMIPSIVSHESIQIVKQKIEFKICDYHELSQIEEDSKEIRTTWRTASIPDAIRAGLNRKRINQRASKTTTAIHTQLDKHLDEDMKS